MTNTITTTEISLAKLTPSPANVRRTGAGAGIEGHRQLVGVATGRDQDGVLVVMRQR